MSGSRHVVCPHCAGINRVPQEKPAETALCGKCGERLFEGRPVEADAAMFARQTERSDVPVLVDVWAPWCGPCRMMAPAYEAAAAALEPRVRLIKLNSEDEPGVASRLGIRGIPTMLLYAGGREVGRVSGAMSTQQIVSWVNGQLGKAG